MARSSLLSSKLTGSWGSTEHILSKIRDRGYTSPVYEIGRSGEERLRAATPKDTGATSAAWYSGITENPDSIDIEFGNANVNNGFNVAVGLAEGHGTGTGGWVNGVDYLNPTSAEIMTDLSDSIWREVIG